MLTPEQARAICAEIDAKFGVIFGGPRTPPSAAFWKLQARRELEAARNTRAFTVRCWGHIPAALHAQHMRMSVRALKAAKGYRDRAAQAAAISLAGVAP